MAKFPTITSGRLSRPAFNRMSAAVKRLDDKDTTRLGLGDTSTGTLPDETVVLIRRPSKGGEPILDADGKDTGDKTKADVALRVRGVRYATARPAAGVYQWDGPEYNAFPDFGSVPMDYVDAFHDPATVPDTETTFLKARKVNGVWVVTLPVSGGDTTIAQYKYLSFLGTGGVGFTLVGGVKHFHDAIRCHKYEADGIVLVADDAGAPVEFIVMLPYLLRGGPFDSQGRGSARNGITYTRVSAQSRDAENAEGDKEEQVIVPPYVSGDRIFAAPAPALHPLSTETATLLEFDSGRAWAAKSSE